MGWRRDDSVVAGWRGGLGTIRPTGSAHGWTRGSKASPKLDRFAFSDFVPHFPPVGGTDRPSCLRSARQYLLLSTTFTARVLSRAHAV